MATLYVQIINKSQKQEPRNCRIPKIAVIQMKIQTKAIIALICVIAFAGFFLLAPVVSYQCQVIFVKTSGSVSLSCEVFGFGEVHEVGYHQSQNAWSDNCQIHSSAFCTTQQASYLMWTKAGA